MRYLMNIRWRNLRIGFKYAIALFISVVLFMISAGIVYNLMDHVKENMKTLENRTKYVEAMMDMTAEFNKIDGIVYNYIIYPDAKSIDDFKEVINNFDEGMSKLSNSDELKDSEELFKDINDNSQRINKIFLDELVDSVDNNNKVEYMKKRKEVSSLRIVTVTKLETLKSVMIKQKEQSIKEVKNSITTTVFVLILSIAFSAVTGFIIMFFITRIIQKRLNQIVEISDQISKGNLSVNKINYKGNDEIGYLSRSFDTMVESLRKMIYQISNASKEVNSESRKLTYLSTEVQQISKQISFTMEDLSAGAEKQADSSSEIASFISVLSKNIMESNEDSKHLSASIDELSKISNKGKELMNQSISQMGRINEIVKGSVVKVGNLDTKSQEITKLVEMINNIAEQTNLLALNAAIEAARAGEAGKGFAVVADEIRKLAEQVKNSVTSITQIIEGIQDESRIVVDSLEVGYNEVQEGTNQIKITGDTFININNEIAQIANRVKNVVDNLTGISDSSEKIGISVEEIAAISQETAAGVEQTLSSVQKQHSSMETITDNAKILSKLSEDLNKSILEFEL